MTAQPRSDEPLVLCVDGPSAGQGFSESTWEARVESARSMHERGEPPQAALGYQRGKTLPDSELPNVLKGRKVTALHWRGLPSERATTTPERSRDGYDGAVIIDGQCPDCGWTRGRHRPAINFVGVPSCPRGGAG